jgi:hypothetical protein
MGKVEELQKAVESLPPDELAKFRTWYEAFDAALFDTKIERDAQSGKLDELVGDALADHHAGRSRAL